MKTIKQKAACSKTALKKIQHSKNYLFHSILSSQRQSQIEQRWSGIPRAYRGTYVKAVLGNSLRAAINAFCLECVNWQIKEIRNCTDLACPLYAVRPYQSSQNGLDEGSSRAESPERR